MTTENPTSHPVRAASLAAVIVILAALLVFPGFVAAGFSRTGSARIVSMNHITWMGFPAVSPPPVARAEMDILAPANWLMYRSEPIRRFYMWQYRLAGGKDVSIFTLIFAK
jgi:hypothetical protein